MTSESTTEQRIDNLEKRVEVLEGKWVECKDCAAFGGIGDDGIHGPCGMMRVDVDSRSRSRLGPGCCFAPKKGA